MPVLTDLTIAEIDRKAKKIFGEIFSKPALMVSDGINLQYACDVRITPRDPTGHIDQYKDWLEHIPKDADGKPLEDYEFGDDLIYGDILRNVPIARNNTDIIYADMGTPVELTRTMNGLWQITGLSLEQPGTYKIYPVHVATGYIGPAIDLSLSTRLLTLGELGTLQPFGAIPFGASGIFLAGELVRIVV